MTIPVTRLINTVNDKISEVSESLEILQLTSVALDFEQELIKSVANCTALPSAPDNKGRWIYLEDRCSYRWSDGIEWTNDFTSTVVIQLRSWGCNTSGRLGDGTTAAKSSPVSVVGGFTDWCAASAGGSHSLGLRSNGTLWVWGLNSTGQLGDGTTTSRLSPVSVVGGFTDWCAASAGGSHSLGVRTDGSLWAWGLNISGQLGDDTITNRSSPVSVVGDFTDWCAASAGGAHSLGVRQDGSLWAWGSNSQGRLGDGTTTTSRLSPVSVVGDFTDWCAASAGSAHSLGVRQDGTLWAWGSNGQGRLGDGTITSRSSPISVVGDFTDWCAASAGNGHSLGVRTNGSLWAWGLNSFGRLGDGTITSSRSPVSVVGGFTDWCAASAGFAHSLGIRQDGSLWSWGNNSDGQLGDDAITDRSSPVSVVGGFTDWCAASAGCAHSLAIRYAKGF
jgi:alpha-tubulin suppressor-like RCC1 family protein